MNNDALPLDLDNCAREPIHIPGRIQAHGLLVAFDAALRVSHRSANVDMVLGALAPALGQPLQDTCFHADPALRELVQECLAADDDGVQPVACEVRLVDRAWELIGHRVGAHMVLELEPLDVAAPQLADDAFKGHRALNRLKHQRSVDELLDAAVQEVRRLTGFDRVMAYRFLHDDSGEIVTEARDAALEPFQGRRYPASDIPAQARRLYVLNTLRIIPDVGAATVAIEARADQPAPLDLSHSVLRSVSPVHIEYLGNMGVGASMSISVVIQGRLWGMLACHHMGPRHVPYRVRSACDVLAHILAAGVQGLLARAHAQRLEEAATVRAGAIEHVLHADEGVFALLPEAQALCAMFRAQGLLVAWQGRVALSDGVPAPTARELLRWLAAQPLGADRTVECTTLDGMPAALRNGMGSWCGLLALRFADAAQGWVVLLRREEVETIAWGGKPDKEYTHGPLGPRLTPRGSFDVWKQEVRGRCMPWSSTDREIGRGLLSDLARAAGARVTELEHARARLLGLLRQGTAPVPAVAQGRSDVSPSRSERLIGQMIDAVAVQGGSGLALQPAPLDLCALVQEVLGEQRALHPAVRILSELPPRTLPLQADATRLRQLVACLLGNACQHGEAGEAVVVQLHHHADAAVLEVSNVGEDMSGERAAALFDPFRPGAQADATPPGGDGLGLGLYIARHIARAHGGELEYAYADPYVLFTLRLPLA